jgi:hypothetical protein
VVSKAYGVPPGGVYSPTQIVQSSEATSGKLTKQGHVCPVLVAWSYIAVLKSGLGHVALAGELVTFVQPVGVDLRAVQKLVVDWPLAATTTSKRSPAVTFVFNVTEAVADLPCLAAHCTALAHLYVVGTVTGVPEITGVPMLP